MAIAGELTEMSLPTLVQLMLQEGGKALIELRCQEKIGRLYLANGVLHHAAITDETKSGEEIFNGEEVVYELLSWTEGKFVVERTVSPPGRTIDQSWDYLLMEGLRRLDEKQAGGTPLVNEEATLAEMVVDISESDAAILQKMVAQQEEKDKMASKSEQLQAILDGTVSNSSDIVGALVVSKDGLLLASNLNGGVDGNRVAAVSAGLISLATRSAQQLNQGDMNQTLIQASGGNIVAIRTGEKGSFVALTPTSANLGMVFIECRDAVEAVNQVL